MGGMTSRSSDDEWWDEEEPVIRYPDVPTVDWDPPETIATFYDLEGEPLLEIEAPRNPIGFNQ